MSAVFKVGQAVNYHAVIGESHTAQHKIRSGPHRIPSCDHDVYFLEGKAGCVSVQALSSEELDVAQAENRALRRLLCLRHGCPTMAMYGDDGELQCSACCIDFKRMTVDEIEEVWRRDALAKLAEQGRKGSI